MISSAAVNELSHLLSRRYGGAPLEVWLKGALLAVGVILALRLLKALLAKRVRGWAGRTQARLDGVIAAVMANTRSFFYIGVGLWAGSEYVQPSTKAERWLRAGISLIVLAQVGLWVQVAIQRLSEHWGAERKDDAGARTMATAIAFIAKLAIWSLLFVMALSSLGFEISALVAGLGVGGVAAALAVQNLLGDLLASLSMFFDRPFDIGDFIIVGGEMGTVERIGLRSTRLRALGGQEIVFANGDLIRSRIHNYRRMQDRRVVLTFGVAYETPIELLEQIPGLVRGMIEARKELRFDRAHLNNYAQISLEFEVVYVVLSADFNLHMDLKQALLIELLRKFREMGVDLARQPSAASLSGATSERALSVAVSEKVSSGQ